MNLQYFFCILLALQLSFSKEIWDSSTQLNSFPNGGLWGVDVLYHESTDDIKKDKLHVQFGTKLYHRSKRFNSDAVDLPSESDNQNLQKLQLLCQRYRE